MEIEISTPMAEELRKLLGREVSDEAIDALIMSEAGLSMAKEFTKVPPKRYQSITEIEIINSLCMMMIGEAKDNDGRIPGFVVFEETPDEQTRITLKGYLTALSYQEGKAMGLKGRPLLDFIYAEMKRRNKFFKEVIRMHEDASYHLADHSAGLN